VLFALRNQQKPCRTLRQTQEQKMPMNGSHQADARAPLIKYLQQHYVSVPDDASAHELVMKARVRATSILKRCRRQRMGKGQQQMLKETKKITKRGRTKAMRPP
jgi:hypothetical protein